MQQKNRTIQMFDDNLKTIMHSFLKNTLRSSFFKLSLALIGTIEDSPSEQNPNCITYKDDFSSTKKTTMTSTQETVYKLIASEQVVIFSKTRCPYCKMAKQVFDSLKQKYTAIELDERDDGDEIQTVLGQLTGARTVPRVFVKGEFIGGGTDVKELYDSGKLQQKL